MLWYKSWLETRWRFLIGLIIVICSAAGAVLTYPEVQRLLPMVPQTAGGELGRRIREAADLASTYRGYVWSQAFRQNLSNMATLFAVLLGTAGLFRQSRGESFTLSLPVTRQRIAGVRAALGLGELLILALVPSLVISLLSPAIGQSYGFAGALAHGVCLFVAASVFFSLAFLLSTVFDDPWRPALIALGLAFVLATVDQLLHSPPYSLFSVMSGAALFRGGQLPWVGLLASAAASATLYWASVANIARRDF